MQDTEHADKMCAKDSFAFRELHVICRIAMGKKQFDFVDHKESPGTVDERYGVILKIKQPRRSR